MIAGDRVLLAEAATPLLKSGYRIESEAPGVMVLVAAKIKSPIVGPLILSVLTFGIFFVIWMGLLSLPRVHRVTLTVVDGQVVRSKSWRYA